MALSLPRQLSLFNGASAARRRSMGFGYRLILFSPKKVDAIALRSSHVARGAVLALFCLAYKYHRAPRASYKPYRLSKFSVHT